MFTYYEQNLVTPKERLWTKHRHDLINSRLMASDQAESNGCPLPPFVQEVLDTAPWLGSMCHVVDGEQIFAESHVLKVEVDIDRPQPTPDSLRRRRRARHSAPIYDPALVMGGSDGFVLLGWNGVQADVEQARRHRSISRARHAASVAPIGRETPFFPGWKETFIDLPLAVLFIACSAVGVLSFLLLIVFACTGSPAKDLYLAGVTTLAAWLIAKWAFPYAESFGEAYK